MVRSMTGFGRGEAKSELGTAVVEVKSVNHRFCEVAARFPKELVALEDRTRALVTKRVARGRVDVFLNWEESRAGRRIVEVDKELALAYYKACKELEAELGISSGADAAFIARLPDVVRVTEVPEDIEAVWPVLETALSSALDELIAMREAEGVKLGQDLLARTACIESYVELIAARAPAMVEDYRRQLRDRLSELLPPNAVDEQRLAMEVALFADRAGITEELVRLRSHCGQLRSMLAASEAIGRKLDFLLQEMNREINTIGAKASDPAITNLVIEVKSELERIREQAQNIE